MFSTAQSQAHPPHPHGPRDPSTDDQPAARGLGYVLFADSDLTSEGPGCNGKYSWMGRDPGVDEEPVICSHRTSEPAWAKRGLGPQGRKGETLPPTHVLSSRGLGRANEPPGHPAGPLRCCYSSVTGVPPRAGMRSPSPWAHPSERLPPFPARQGQQSPLGGLGKKESGEGEGIWAPEQPQGPQAHSQQQQ